MVGALSRLVDKNNKDYFYVNNDGHKVHGQFIPIPGNLLSKWLALDRVIYWLSFFPVFYLSFIVTPICSNASELVSSLIFAAKKRKINSSMTFSQVQYNYYNTYVHDTQIIIIMTVNLFSYVLNLSFMCLHFQRKL